MTISDKDLIDAWFGGLTAPEIVKELGLQSTKELRLHWRRFKELGQLPLTSRVGVGGKFDRGSGPARSERDLLLERLRKVYGQSRNDQLKKDE